MRIVEERPSPPPAGGADRRRDSAWRCWPSSGASGDFYCRAACRNVGPQVFFEDVFPSRPDGSDGAADRLALKRARSICAACPVRTECHAYAMTVEADLAGNRRFGVFAGLTPLQRYALWRRDSWWCRECGSVFDPLGIVAGDAVCGCGWRHDLPVSDAGDQWFPRHDQLLRRLVTWVLANTHPGDRIPPPYRMLELLGYRRKDDMPLLYEHLVHDGLLARGPRKGEYYRRGADADLINWRPLIQRRVG